MSDFSSKSVVGLTGGIATGKSTALQKFMELGWSVLSADSIVEKILATDVNIQKKLTGRWGEDVKEICGRIDKGAVGRIVFKNNSERQWLESLLHPMVRSKWISFVHSRPDYKCMIELPLLFETTCRNTLLVRFPCLHLTKRALIDYLPEAPTQTMPNAVYPLKCLCSKRLGWQTLYFLVVEKTIS